MPFEIVVHAKPNLLEVIYPVAPTTQEVLDYILRAKRAIDGMRGEWCALVDQRAVTLLAPKVVEHLSKLNAYAVSRGMKRSARVVGSSVSSLQARRMVDEAAHKAEMRAFPSREAAWSWLSNIT